MFWRQKESIYSIVYSSIKIKHDCFIKEDFFSFCLQNQYNVQYCCTITSTCWEMIGSLYGCVYSRDIRGRTFCACYIILEQVDCSIRVFVLDLYAYCLLYLTNYSHPQTLPKRVW